MNKVVIIDDEYYTRQALIKSINWPDVGYEIVGDTDNGKKGYNLILQEKPDVAIIDINMPIMNGMELIRKLREENINVFVVILTGYNDFEFAKKAISYNVHSYILKPIMEEELINSLKQISAEIDKNKTIDLQIEKSVEVLKREFLNKLISNVLLEEQIINNYLRNFDINIGKYSRILSVVLDCNHKQLDVEPELNKDGIIKIPKLIFSAGSYINCWFSEVNVLSVLISSNENMNIEDKNVRQGLGSLMLWLNHKMNLEEAFYIGVGPIVFSHQDISSSYEISKIVNEEKKGVVFCNGQLNSTDNLIKSIKLYVIDECSNSELNILYIVKRFNFNYHYLCKLFKQKTGETLGDYIIKIRMIKAKTLIDSGVTKVDEISEKCGYNDSGYFGKSFKKFYNVSPKKMMTEYKK